MSLFEEHLTLGQWLSEEERLALYKYLLIFHREKYNLDCERLLSGKSMTTFFANGEIFYSIYANKVSYKSRRIGSELYSSENRTLFLAQSNFNNRRKLHRFFAQAELDVLRNFPIPSSIENREGGYSTNFYPFYDLNYYSNGRGKIIGLFKKLQAKDDELLEKLLASA
jgi:hypothetical protein